MSHLGNVCLSFGTHDLNDWDEHASDLEVRVSGMFIYFEVSHTCSSVNWP